MLNSLEIKNFRALEDFKVAKLGRVNLIVGKNNSGKSSVLEALRIYAGNANRTLLTNIAASHDEKSHLNYEEESSSYGLPYEDLFPNRQFPKDKNIAITIGESVASQQTLQVHHIFYVEKERHVTDEKGITTKQTYWDIDPNADGILRGEGLSISKGDPSSKGNQFFTIMFGSTGYQGSTKLEEIHTPCSFVPTQLISMNELASEWDKIVFTEHGEIVKQAIRIISTEFENIYFIQNNSASSSMAGNSRTAIVKLAHLPRPVPLKSLGDGMIRILQLALKLVSAQGGFLLIDELENGLHYSIQEKVWAWLFEVAERLDIQVFTTTHSWDCIENFTKVAIANETTEGIVFRMGKSAKTSNRGQIIATVFDKESLYTMTQAGIEIR